MTMFRQRATYLAYVVARRELIHRQIIVLGMAALLVLSAGPLLGHHIGDGLDRLVAGRDHIGAICLIALHLVLEPVHHLFHVLLAAGLLYATWDRFRAWRRMHRSLAPLMWSIPRQGDAFWSAASECGVDPARVRVVHGLPAPAFTVGWIRPVIYIARALSQRLSPSELTAVLAHEGAHVARRDPLRLSLVRFLADTLFWLPAVQRLADDLADEAEIEADDAAARVASVGGPLTLASALVSAAAAFAATRSQAAVGSHAVALCSAREPDLLDRRVLRLVGEDAPVRSHLSRRGVWLTAATLGMVWLSSVAVAHPMPSSHCTHASGWAVAHLFCQAGTRSPTTHCTHSG